MLLIAILGFVGVGRLVTSFHARERSLASQLFTQGQQEREAGKASKATQSFRAALGYDPGNLEYELNLAKALVEAKRYDEAKTYLLSLYERAPQDGEVNLELARLSALQENQDDAVRYYHHAIYGIWDQNPDQQRRQARLELVEFLLKQGDLMSARSELIASASGLPPAEPEPHLRIAGAFMQDKDYDDALRQYREVIRMDRKNQNGYIGAGKAAFQLRQYRTAQRYLQSADRLGNLDPYSAQLMKTAELLLANDPYLPNLSDAERQRRVTTAFEKAGARLHACAQQRGEDLMANPPVTPLQELEAEWVKLKPAMRPAYLRRKPNTAEEAMDLVFRIEQQTQTQCGNPEGLDLALTIIGRDREGTEQ